jgi:hypothetical protein
VVLHTDLIIRFGGKLLFQLLFAWKRFGLCWLRISGSRGACQENRKAGNRDQGTGNREQGSENRDQGTGKGGAGGVRFGEAGNREQGTGKGGAGGGRERMATPFTLASKLAGNPDMR